MKKLLASTLLLISFILPVHGEEDSFDSYFTYIGTHEYDHPNNTIYLDQGKKETSLTLWKNDKKHLKIALQAKKNTTITIDSDYEVALLQNTYASLGVEDKVSLEHIYIPEIIKEVDTIDIAKDNTHYLWVTVTSSQDTGHFLNTITIKDKDGFTQDLKVNLEVLDIALPETNNLSLDLWQYPYTSARYYNVEPFSQEHMDILRDHMSTYKELGGNTITVSIIDEPWGHQTYDDYPSMITWYMDSAGSLSFDYTIFDTWVNLCITEGIDCRIEAFSILPFDNAITYHKENGSIQREVLEVGSERWKDIWHQFLVSYIDHLSKNGWLDEAYIFIDERDDAYVKSAIELIKDPSLNHQLKIASAINKIPSDYSFYDDIDLLSLSLACTDASVTKLIEHRKELGLNTTMYTCSTNYPNSFAISNPDESIWTIEYLYSLGFDGFLRWAYDAWNEDPLTTLDYIHFEAGDILLVYPDDKDVAKSVRLEMLEQGFRNVRKLNYLETNGIEIENLDIKKSSGNFNTYGAMLAANDNQSKITSTEVMRIDSLIDEYSRKAIPLLNNNQDETIAKIRKILSDFFN